MHYHGGRNHLPVTTEGGKKTVMRSGKQYPIPVTNTGKFYGDHNTISSQVIFKEITEVIGGVKISHDLRERIEMVGTAYEDMGEGGVTLSSIERGRVIQPHNTRTNG